MRSLTTRSMRSRPMRKAFWISSPLARMRRLPRWSMSSGWPRPLLSSMSWPTMAAMSSRLMRPLVARQLDAHARGDRVQLLVELVAAHAAEVVAAEVEEEALDELLGVVTGGRVARAQLLVDLDEGLAAGRWWRPSPASRRCTACSSVSIVRNSSSMTSFVLVAHGAQELGGLQLALAVDLDPQLEHVLLGRRLELEPGAAVGDDLGAEQVAPGAGVLRPRCSRRPASGPAG